MDWLTTPSQRNLILTLILNIPNILNIFNKKTIPWNHVWEILLSWWWNEEASKCFQTTSVLRKWVSCLSCVYCQWLWLPRFVPDLSATNWPSSIFHCICTNNLKIQYFSSCSHASQSWPLDRIASFSGKVSVLILAEKFIWANWVSICNL